MVITNANNVTESGGADGREPDAVGRAGHDALDRRGEHQHGDRGLRSRRATITADNTITTTNAGTVTFTNAGLLTLNGDISSDGAVTQNRAGGGDDHVAAHDHDHGRCGELRHAR